MSKLAEAIELAVEAHKGQFRKDGFTPFVCHPIEVMSTLRHWKIIDEEILVAAILHDVVEDWPHNSRDKIKEKITVQFGSKVAETVNELTYVKGVNYHSKKDYIKAFGEKSIEAVVVKLADRYRNVLDFLIEDDTRDYAVKYYEKAMPLFVTIQDRRAEFINRYGREAAERLSNDYLWLAARISEVKILENITGCPRGGGPMRWS